MKKALKYILAVLWTAWTGALTIVAGVAMIVGLLTFAERFLNNNIVAVILMAILLVVVTLSAGGSVKDWLRKGD